MTALATVQSEDARRAATTDRDATANLVLEMAVKDAIGWIKAGRPGYARYRLERAVMSAQRILGRTA